MCQYKKTQKIFKKDLLKAKTTRFASFGPVLITAAFQNSSCAVNTNIEPKKSELVPKNLKYIQKRYRGNLKDVGYFSSSFKVRN